MLCPRLRQRVCIAYSGHSQLPRTPPSWNYILLLVYPARSTWRKCHCFHNDTSCIEMELPLYSIIQYLLIHMHARCLACNTKTHVARMAVITPLPGIYIRYNSYISINVKFLMDERLRETFRGSAGSGWQESDSCKLIFFVRVVRL